MTENAANGLKRALLNEFSSRSCAQLQDMIKLIYQNEFAGGHLITDRDGALKRLQAEYGEVAPNREQPLFEDIGNGISRLNLSALKACAKAPKLQTVNGMFAATAEVRKGSEAGFEEKLLLLKQLCGSGELPFGDISQALADYKGEGYPPKSHTEQYRESCSPAYRVVDSRFAQHFELFADIDRVLEEKGSCLLAIDGGSGTGKSSLAELIQKVYGAESCNIFHTDDFFLQKHQRTPERFAEVGGNIDYERLESEVLEGIASGRSFEYRPFECWRMELGGSVKVEAKPLAVIEGVYSLHPRFCKRYDLSILLKESLDTRLARIRERDGEEMLRRFVNEWIPLEDRYFELIHR